LSAHLALSRDGPGEMRANRMTLDWNEY